MFKKIATLIFLILNISLSNDGAFFASGNQLIPIEESEISVTKEMLSIKRISKSFIEVTVEYEFFNPKTPKEILVGFEAQSPLGDVNGTPRNGHHPYIHSFLVIFNEKVIPYEVSIVDDSLYYKSGKIVEKNESEVVSSLTNVNWVEFNYVYSFKASFKKGINKVLHKYIYKLSNSVSDVFNFSYLLSPAKRWANKQIDNFTLSIDLGQFQDFIIRKTFFIKNSDWLIDGIIEDAEMGDFYLYSSAPQEPVSHFVINKGPIIFKKKNFKPEGELILSSPVTHFQTFDYQNHKLAFSLDQASYKTKSKDIISYKILRNLPFARRGYVFKTPEIDNYYRQLFWYQPDSSNKTNYDLSEDEKEWIKKVNQAYNNGINTETSRGR